MRSAQVLVLRNTLAKVERHRKSRRSGAGVAPSLLRPNPKNSLTINYASRRLLKLAGAMHTRARLGSLACIRNLTYTRPIKF